MSRGFDYYNFVKRVIDASSVPVLPIRMSRQAVSEGADKTGEDLLKQLRLSCESLANSKDYKRVKIKGTKGYHYTGLEN